jgi:hypothetical protein
MSTYIRTVVSSTSKVEEKGMLSKQTAQMVANVDTDSLKKNLNDLMENLSDVFSAQQERSPFGLKQVEVGVEITAEGGVNLIGSITAGAKASITLTFERS